MEKMLQEKHSNKIKIQRINFKKPYRILSAQRYRKIFELNVEKKQKSENEGRK